MIYCTYLSCRSAREQSSQSEIAAHRCSAALKNLICACDGIGRHARFRFSCSDACGFESLQAHHVGASFVSLAPTFFQKSERAHAAVPPFQIEPAPLGIDLVSFGGSRKSVSLLGPKERHDRSRVFLFWLQPLKTAFLLRQPKCRGQLDPPLRCKAGDHDAPALRSNTERLHDLCAGLWSSEPTAQAAKTAGSFQNSRNKTTNV